MQLSRQQVEIYQFLKRDVVQHLLFGVAVFCCTFCFFAVHAWYQSKADILRTLDYKSDGFWLIFREASLYTLFMALPVYSNLLLIYRGKWRFLLRTSRPTPEEVKGWAFYLFLIASFLLALIFSFLFSLIFKNIFTLINQPWYELIIVILFFVLCTTGVSFTKQAIERNRELERRERLEAIRRRQKAERELQFIKRQIRPHFLFNTLANLQILAQEGARELPYLISELSQLLRYLVYRTNEKTVLVEDEIDFIRSYIGLQRIQLSRDVDLRFEIGNSAGANGRVAPMVLLSIIENCFKHYYGNKKTSPFIHIQLEVCPDRLRLVTANTFHPSVRNEGRHGDGGVGLASAREHLQLLYGTDYQLLTRAEEQVYYVDLTMPLL